MARDRDRSRRSESNDEDHVNILGVCYYIYGALATLCSLCPGFYLVMGLMFLTGVMKPPPPQNANGQPWNAPPAPNPPPFVVNGPQGNGPAANNPPLNPNPPPFNPQQAQAAADEAFEWVGWLFTIGGGLAILLGWAYAICMITAGSMLRQKRRRTFCLIMAAFACLNQPLGLVLGIFTFIVLLRPSVKEMFEENDHPRTRTEIDPYDSNPGGEG